MSWEKPKTGFQTEDCFQNLGFEHIEFFSPKWKAKELESQQVFFDTPGAPETFLLIDKKSMELFAYFDDFGDKNNPKILKLCTLDKRFLEAYQQIAMCKTAFIRWYEKFQDYKSLCKKIESLTTAEKLKTALELSV